MNIEASDYFILCLIECIAWTPGFTAFGSIFRHGIEFIESC